MRTVKSGTTLLVQWSDGTVTVSLAVAEQSPWRRLLGLPHTRVSQMAAEITPEQARAVSVGLAEAAFRAERPECCQTVAAGQQVH